MNENLAIVADAFDRWRDGDGHPFELLSDDAEWTIAGSSSFARTYHGRREYLEVVVRPFNARLADRLVPHVRRIFADGDTVVALFDATALARDGRPYRNTYSWHLQMRNGQIVNAIAFFDARPVEELWARVAPA